MRVLPLAEAFLDLFNQLEDDVLPTMDVAELTAAKRLYLAEACSVFRFQPANNSLDKREKRFDGNKIMHNDAYTIGTLDLMPPALSLYNSLAFYK